MIEKLIKNRIDPTLESVNKLEAGSRKGRGCADNIYLLRGLIDHSKYLGKTLDVNLYDYRQCFHSMWLQDSLISLWLV